MGNFWFENDGKISVSHLYLKNWFKSMGYYRHYIDSKQWIMVKIKDRIIEEVELLAPKNECLNYLLNLPEDNEGYEIRIRAYEYLYLKSSHYFGKEFLETLDSTTDIKNFYIMRDTESHSFKFYKNCVLILDKEGIKEIPYKRMYGYIWKTQVIDREWKKVNGVSVYEKFIDKISGDDKLKKQTFKSIIGYYLWTYKSPTFLPCITLTDEVLSNNACGRTGKGLFFTAIGKMLKMVKLDGKKFDFNYDFCFQLVSHDTQLVVIEDVERKFDFEKLFSILSEGMEINKKNKASFFLGFDDSPRFGLTTNYALRGNTDSYMARIREVELKKYFSAEYTPEHEFNHKFFIQWTNEEWLLFDNFMIDCIMFFMNFGFVKSDNKYYQYKKLLNTLGEDVIELFDDLKRDQWYSKADLKVKIKTVSDMKHIGTRKIKEYMDCYCDYHGLRVDEGRVSDVRSVKFVEKDSLLELS